MTTSTNEAHNDPPLPYTLPPGPYSKEKPDFTQTAIIGQAILSSPNHSLTLQEIYDWITTVYPYYKRVPDGNGWMASIRHNLSVTSVFRKVSPRVGCIRHLWAIFDEDLHYFKDGVFENPDHMGKGKENSKRAREGASEDCGDLRKSKRRKTMQVPLRLSSNGSRPYYRSSLSRTRSPSAAAVNHYRPVHDKRGFDQLQVNKPTTILQPIIAPSQIRTQSALSPMTENPTEEDDEMHSLSEEQDDELDNTAALKPVKFWGNPWMPNDNRNSQFQYAGSSNSDEDCESLSRAECSQVLRDSSEETPSLENTLRTSSTSRPLPSPISFSTSSHRTPFRDVNDDCEPQTIRDEESAYTHNSPRAPSPSIRPHSNSNSLPQPSKSLPLSTASTPISYKGLHMWPTISLAHYKTHLHPPPRKIWNNFESGFFSYTARGGNRRGRSYNGPLVSSRGHEVRVDCGNGSYYYGQLMPDGTLYCGLV